MEFLQVSAGTPKSGHAARRGLGFKVNTHISWPSTTHTREGFHKWDGPIWGAPMIKVMV